MSLLEKFYTPTGNNFQAFFFRTARFRDKARVCGLKRPIDSILSSQKMIFLGKKMIFLGKKMIFSGKGEIFLGKKWKI
jgi:hypothetical protein